MPKWVRTPDGFHVSKYMVMAHLLIYLRSNLLLCVECRSGQLSGVSSYGPKRPKAGSPACVAELYKPDHVLPTTSGSHCVVLAGLEHALEHLTSEIPLLLPP